MAAPTAVVDQVLDELRRVVDLPDTLVADEVMRPVAQAAADRVWERLTTSTDHSTHPADTQAAVLVAVQLWQAQRAPGGTMLDSDMGPIVAPHLAGPGLLARVRGLVGDCWSAAGWVG